METNPRRLSTKQAASVNLKTGCSILPKCFKMKNNTWTDQGQQAVSFTELKITSEAFNDGEMIPLKYTCDGANINPPLNIQHIPKQAKSLVILTEDVDAPVRPWTHWLAWNIPVTHHIQENQLHGTLGLNDFDYLHYTGPCPVSGTHRYVFRIYALDKILDIPFHTRKFRLQQEFSGHVIGFGELTGLYAKQRKYFSDFVLNPVK